MIGQGIRTVVLALVVVLFMGMAHERNIVWNTLLSLWQDTAAKSPNKSRVFNNLGNCYILAGRYFKGIEAYQRAVALDQNNGEAYYNLGVNFENVGIMNKAAYYYDWFCNHASSDYREQQGHACKRAAELARSVVK
jgi:tetratricopeptide (TPR) repeat protein